MGLSIPLQGATRENCNGSVVGGPFYNLPEEMATDHPTANGALSLIFLQSLRFHWFVVFNVIAPSPHAP